MDGVFQHSKNQLQLYIVYFAGMKVNQEIGVIKISIPITISIETF